MILFDKAVVTPLGRSLLKRKKEQLEKIILDTQEGLVDLNRGAPDDGFQDGYLLDTQMNIRMMEQQLGQITELLRDAVEAQKPQQSERVELGHKVRLHLTYPSGDSEQLTIVLIPSQELWLVEEELPNEELTVSPNSALGKAILGQKAGSSFAYEVDAGCVNGKLLKIEIWQHAFEPSESYALS